MNIKNGVGFAKRIIKLLKEFSEKSDTTPNEFIDYKLRQEDLDADLVELFENFLLLMRHDKFFDTVVENFWSYYQLKSFNKEIITTLVFILIFGLNKENLTNILEIFIGLKYRFCFHVVEYFTIEENIVDVAQAGCRVFDNDYTLEHILHPLLNNKYLIESLLNQVHTKLIERTQISVKPSTKPVPPACATKTKRNPSPPLNTPIGSTIFKSNDIARTVLQGDAKIKESLEKARKENKEKAAKLLKLAREKAFKCANRVVNPQEEIVCPAGKSFTCGFKSKKVPSYKNVTIKRNAASLMREAAVLVKDKESEIKKLEALTQTIFDPTTLDLLEDDIRKCKEQQHLQDIEKKHLQGQLTYEEAILAKQNLLKANQEKMEKFKEERVTILEEIEIWREKEQEKIKALVERSQNIEKAAKDAEKKMQREKKIQARIVEKETKELLKEAYLKKQEELAYRVTLIQELRALQQVRSFHVKEFDPTESPNFGLLCEMSIAELQERLGLLKMELHEELERRRKTVVESREKQQQLIESVKQFICQSRVAKPKPVPRSPVKLEQTPDLTALRERLQQAKQNRISTQRSGVS